MADKKISQLTAATALSGAEVTPVVQSDSTKKATIDQILTPAAGKGVNFSANTPSAGMTSQLLSWYEEGTFTPVVVGDVTPGAATYTEQAGYFQRIGNCVFYHIAVAWSAHTGTGDIAPITGLPYTSNGNIQPSAAIYNNGYAALSGTIQAFVGRSAASVVVNQVDTSTGIAAALPLDTVVGDLRISGHYFI